MVFGQRTSSLNEVEGKSPILTQLVTDTGAIALRATLGCALICTLVRLLADVSICLDKAYNRLDSWCMFKEEEDGRFSQLANLVNKLTEGWICHD